MLLYTIRYHRLVIEKDLRTIDISVWESIRDTAREKLSRYPEQFGKPLRNVLRGLRVLRVSDWRIVFRIEENEILIGAVRHRRDGYQSIEERFI